MANIFVKITYFLVVWLKVQVITEYVAIHKFPQSRHYKYFKQIIEKCFDGKLSIVEDEEFLSRSEDKKMELYRTRPEIGRRQPLPDCSNMATSRQTESGSLKDKQQGEGVAE